MSGTSRDSIELVIPSDPGRISEADDFLETALRSRGVPDAIVSDMAIATTELVNNAIVHGNKRDATKTVILSLQITDSEVVIRVVDQGEGFDPGQVPDPLAQENLLREVGRGIFIARSLMDDVRYERNPGGGMVVIVRKSLNPA
ncbi:MAG: ATP-binding protein [candidate division Zixibacteria bacterium]|nr:ATP-binding protein [candidate division Zixibacteria bacterium]